MKSPSRFLHHCKRAAAILLVAALLLLQVAGPVLGRAPETPPAEPSGPSAVSFTEAVNPLVADGVCKGSAAWGDYDNDGYLDVLISGRKYDSGAIPPSCSNQSIAQVYRNNGAGSFTSADTLSSSYNGKGQAAWGDFDNDGKLDVAMSGMVGADIGVKIFHNTGSGFTETFDLAATTYQYGLANVDAMSLAWGDADNDGLLELLVGGYYNNVVPGGVWVYHYQKDSAAAFTKTATLTETDSSSSLAWGDYNNDGLLDVLMTTDGYGGQSAVYRNTGAGFTLAVGLNQLAHGSAAWGDYNADGKLDILMTGHDGSMPPQTRVHRNASSGSTSNFVQTSDVLTGLTWSSAAWSDYDNDGLLDFIVSGQDAGNTARTLIYRNTGSVFNQVDFSLTGVTDGDTVWGDYDKDGQLDLLVMGCSDGTSCASPISKIYRGSGALTNAAPTAPSGLNASVTGSKVQFTWAAASDDHTPTKALTYNLYVTSADGATTFLAPAADLASGFRRLPGPGNVGANLNASLTLPDGSYKWSVQALDGAWKGGPFQPTEGTFTVGSAGCQVTTNADSGAGSLRAAVAAASPGDTICFAPALSGQTITLASEIVLAKNLTISSAGAITINGNNATRLFSVGGGAQVTLNHLILRGGKAPQTEGGAAIRNAGILTVRSSILTANTSNFSGGGIYNAQTLIVENSTFSANSTSGSGGAISNSGQLTVQNSTFTGNSASGQGGAISTFTSTLPTIKASVFSANTPNNVSTNGSAPNGGFNVSSDASLGAGQPTDINNAGPQTQAIQADGTAPLLDTSAAIGRVSDPTLCANPDLAGTARLPAPCDAGALEFTGTPAPKLLVSVRPSAERPYAGQTGFTYTVTVQNPGPTEVTSVALSLPLPTGLAHNGAPPSSGGGGCIWDGAGSALNCSRIAAGSSLVATVPATVSAAAGKPLTITASASAANATAGSGSYQIITSAPPASTACVKVVSTTADSGAGSLRQAVLEAVSPCTILFSRGIQGQTVRLDTPIELKKNLTINGLDLGGDNQQAPVLQTLWRLSPLGLAPLAGMMFLRPRKKNGRFARSGGVMSLLALALLLTACFPKTLNITISGQNKTTIFSIGGGATVTLESLTIREGRGTTSAIYNAGSLTVQNSTISANFGEGTNGGGINNSGNLWLQNTTLSGNTADNAGGALYNGGTGTVMSCTFTGNTGGDGGGGAIYNSGTLTVLYSTLSGNMMSPGFGGAIENTGTLTMGSSTVRKNKAYPGLGGGIFNSGTLTVNNSVFSGNVAAVGNGGGISNSGMLTVQNSTFSGNSVLMYTTSSGSGIYNANALTLKSSILWGNSGAISVGGILNPATITNNVLQEAIGGSNIDLDPLFVRNAGANGGADDGDLHLRAGSPAEILGGECPGYDMDSTERPATGCSAGAYEYSDQTAAAAGGLAQLAPNQGQTVLPFPSNEGTVTLDVPAGAVTQDVHLAFSLRPFAGGDGRIHGVVFTPYDNNDLALPPDLPFQKPVTLTLGYDPTLVTHGLEGDLLPVLYNPASGRWEPFTTDVVVDKTAQTVAFPIGQTGAYGLVSVAQGVYVSISAAAPAGVQNLSGGAQVRYTLTALNTKSSLLGPLTITHTLPAGLTFVDWVDANGADINAGTITWNLAGLAGGGAQQASFDALVSSDPAYQGQAVVSTADWTDNGSLSGSAETQITVNGPVAPADDAALTRPVTAVTIYPLANDANPDGSPLALTAVDAPANGTAQIAGSSVVYTPTTPGVFTDSFSYTVEDGDFTRSGTISVRVALLANVNVFQTVAFNGMDSNYLPGVPKGRVVTYTLTIINNPGGEAGQNVALSDTLPAGVTFAGWVTQAGAAIDNGVITWSAASLPVSSSVTIQFQAAVTGIVGAAVTNTANLQAGNADPTSASADFPISPIPLYLPFISRKP